MPWLVYTGSEILFGMDTVKAPGEKTHFYLLIHYISVLDDLLVDPEDIIEKLDKLIEV